MIGIEKYLLVKIKGIVTVKAGVEVEKAWYTDLPFLVHNVGEGGNRSAIACSDALVLHLDILLVVEGRIAFIAVDGAPSSNSAVSKSRVARKSVCEHISCCLELVTDKAESQKPSSHCVFWIFRLLRFCTCRFNFLCHLAECQAKLNVAF